MKKLAFWFTVFLLGLWLMPGLASAQGQTASGTLTVTANLVGSISITFVTDASGVTLASSGTTAASLAFGNVSVSSSPPSEVTETVGATSFTISTPFDVSVTKSNVTSANYALTAEMQTTDAVNSWKIDTFPLTTVPAAGTSLTVTGVYDTNVSHTLFLTMPFTEGSKLISNTIDFVATAN
jgi:hypothetical protein